MRTYLPRYVHSMPYTMYTQTLYLPFSFSFAGSIFQLKHCRGRKWNPPPVLAEDSGARTTSINPHPAGPSQCKLNGQAFRGGAAMGVWCLKRAVQNARRSGLHRRRRTLATDSGRFP